MAVKVISDIHGEYAALAVELQPGDTAILLGDYLNLIDFHTLEGILAQVYTREEIIAALAALAQGRSEPAKRSIQEISGASPEKYRRVRELVVASYEEFFASIPCRCIMIYGNTDNPQMLQQYLTGDVELVECGVVELSGERFGFVSGSPHGPWTVGLPGEMEPGEYRRRVESLGPVDVLCTHYPPAIPDLTWDLLADRDEVGSDALLEYVDEHAPRRHYFGHVHNPRAGSHKRGATRLVNAGFFRKHRTVLIHE